MSTTHSDDLLTLLGERTSIRHYDKSESISKEELTKILESAVQAPSAWNLQHWNFMVFHSDEAKERLLPIAYSQNQIVESSAVVAILGDLEANKNTDQVYNPLVDAGFMTKEIKETLAGQINGAYTNPVYARDAAYSNASLAAMQLMLTAKALGFDTCAIGGFNGEELVKEFKISDRYVPVMLISIGKAAKPAHKSDRISLDQLSVWL
ncbi:nitroreductase family protein [Bacillus sp. FJAT-42376]|uniref:nitroreductase family protein n=1 Tax=Bacillus sp. FJAT-42376 TaxID=2014076 RepID=UPI000F51424B|nr:nitroreductase family protein [Bacillus sp. FJAT-42376]AZB43190.1 nitroreductase family protein [Bacillus sp. FJAT-42376]